MNFYFYSIKYAHYCSLYLENACDTTSLWIKTSYLGLNLKNKVELTREEKMVEKRGVSSQVHNNIKLSLAH